MLKDRELHNNDPLLALPFDSIVDFFPKRVIGQVNEQNKEKTIRGSF